MAQWLEFISAHYVLVSIFSALLGALLILESRRGGQSVSTASATHLINKSDAVVVDIRSEKEFNQGHIVGAINIPFSDLKQRINELDVYRNNPIIVACAIGQHAGVVGAQLKQAGFNNVVRLSGGVNGWKAGGLPLVK
jgi:rhodanese-related sulfurtransferase